MGYRTLPGRVLSESIQGPNGEPAVMIESLEVRRGQQVALTFESTGPRWRRGVFLATDGRLEAAGETSSSLYFWSDTAPTSSVISVIETAGQLVLYNIWDSGRGAGRFESQSHTSGMLVESLPEGSRRYSCTDIGLEPDFTRLVFRVSIE